MFRRLSLLLVLSCPLFAQDGQQLFTLYCSACHAPDGKGATGGTFPPLAGSPWVGGDPDRFVKIVLHGLQGPIEVLGKSYNLAMPPQGAMLPDDQIAAIVTYVRSAWGNAAAPVTTEFVKATRAATKNRLEMWTAEELLKLHPLPFEKTALTNLISQVYSGKWNNLPDFSTLKAENVEEEHDGIISLTDSAQSNEFAMTWKADFTAPADGEYRFILDADDAAAINIDGKPFLRVDGSGPMDGSRSKQANIKLTQGTHPISVEYLEIGGNRGITLGWKKAGTNNWNWLTDTKPAVSGSGKPSIPIAPTNDRAVIYRNFIEGASSRAIGVGFPGDVNLAYSAENLAPALIWTGPFMDGAQKWLDRGTDKSSPAGENVIRLSNARTLPEAARFRGYKLDPAGNPTFAVQIGEQILLDSWSAKSETLVRKLTITGAPLEIQIPQPPGITIEGASGKPTLTLTPSQPVTLTYRWK